MPPPIFKVDDVATIEYRGVLAVGNWQFAAAKPDETIAHGGDAIELERATEIHRLDAK